jgi:hypothetical protein
VVAHRQHGLKTLKTRVTGTRADEVISDDVESPDNSATQGMREKLGEKIKEFDSILKPGDDS